MGLPMLFAFLFLMILGVPLYLSLLSTSLLGIVMLGDLSLLRVMSQQFFGGMDIFSLMAIPFFILSGILMNRTGLTDRLLDFSRLLVGSVRGGLGYVNVVGGIILAGGKRLGGSGCLRPRLNPDPCHDQGRFFSALCRGADGG